MNRRAQGTQDEQPFPVIEEQALPHVPGRFFVRRDLNLLPQVHPGTMLVFKHGSRYEAFSDAEHLTGREEPVVDATEVSLVDLRSRVFTLYLPLPSASPADDFTVKVSFRARVTDAERVAAEGPANMTGLLASYLDKHAPLTRLGREHSVAQIADVRDLVSSHIEAYCDLNPIDMPGLEVKLDTVGVLTPRELRAHDQRMRDERWNQELEDLQAEGLGRKADWHKQFVDKGSSALTALGLARGETTANEAIGNAREDEHRMRDQIADVFRSLHKEGQFDLVDFDASQMAHIFLEKLTGQSIPTTSHMALNGRGHAKLAGPSSGDDDEDDEQPNEADLDE
jgi:hypothetical protein